LKNKISGINTKRFTAANTLFLNNPDVIYWRFEVVYKFPNESSLSALNFVINQPPENGSCSIDPPNGTTTTLFTINCTGWIDEDNIKDYSFYRENIFFKKKTRIILIFCNKRFGVQVFRTNDACFHNKV